MAPHTCMLPPRRTYNTAKTYTFLLFYRPTFRHFLTCIQLLPINWSWFTFRGEKMRKKLWKKKSETCPQNWYYMYVTINNCFVIHSHLTPFAEKKKKAKDAIFCWFFNQWPIIWRHTRSKKWLFFYNLSCQNHCRQKVYPKRMAKVHLLWPVIWNSPIEGTEKVIKERSQRFIIGILNFLIHSECLSLYGVRYFVFQKKIHVFLTLIIFFHFLLSFCSSYQFSKILQLLEAHRGIYLRVNQNSNYIESLQDFQENGNGVNWRFIPVHFWN